MSSLFPAARWTRRETLTRLVFGGLAVCGGTLRAEPEEESKLTFFVVADPQIHLDKSSTLGIEKMIQVINELLGKDFPLGGKVGEPRAVIIAGDLTDVVDDPRHWECYKRFFDPNGGALLRFRTFELIGNHDLSTALPVGELSSLQREFTERNKRRRGDVFHFDADHYHYSWNWGRCIWSTPTCPSRPRGLAGNLVTLDSSRSCPSRLISRPSPPFVQFALARLTPVGRSVRLCHSCSWSNYTS